MVKYIVGGVLVVLTWALVILLQLPMWIGLLVTVLVGLVIVLMVGLAKLRERRAARQLEKALQAQAAQDAASARPDLQHEIAEMQAEFQKAVSALKGSKKGGKKALYQLPWYTIIGPPGCGKSTALRNSGLQFPYLSASGGGVRGLGGTRNCDWWMTSEAVILDTAGRWTSEEEDHDEWLGFLDLIKRFRPKKPLNGIIAAVSVGDLGGAREDEVVQLAQRIRQRIDEVQGRLKMSLPVYVLFTKCDLIPGFVETFGDMSKQERGQVWGFTRPLSKSMGAPGEYFAKEFATLLQMLETRAYKRMGDERKVANREMIYAFPQQLAVLESNLQEFVHHLFLENVFKETPHLRGVYFTSGTQEGRPIDRVMSAMAEAFGQQQVQLPAPQVESKSYFLRDTFANVVFKDADVAVRSPEEVRRQRRRTYLMAAAIFLLAMGISGLPAIAWGTNRGYLSETEEIIEEARVSTSVEGAAAQAPLGAEAIEPLRARVMELEEYEDDGPPLHMQMGMYQDDVYEPVRDVYLDALRRRVVGPLVQADVNAMDGFGRRFEALGGQGQPDAVEMREMYERMKLHLLLTVPRGEHEPPLNEELEEYIVEQLHTRWTAATETQRHEREYNLMRDNLRYYVDALSSHPELYFARNPTAIGQVRGVFAAAGGFHMAVQGIIAEIEPLNYGINLAQLVGRDVGSLGAQERVRGAFTKRAWEERVQNILENDAARFFGENWVLGREPPENERVAEIERERQVAGLRSYFLEQYMNEWRTFIDSIYVVRPNNDREHMDVLTDFTDGEPQLVTRLIRQIDYNVTLFELGGSGEGGLGEAGERAEREAERRFLERGPVASTLGRENTRRLLGEGRDRAEQEVQERMGSAGALPPDAMTERRLRQRFMGLIGFAPSQPTDVPEGETEQVTPSRRYEEQLEFLRDALGFRMAGTNVTNFEERQERARELTRNLIADRPDGWRERFRTLLMPPIEGPAWEPPEEAEGEGAEGEDAEAAAPTDDETATASAEGPEPEPPQPEPTQPEPTRPRRGGGGGGNWWQ
ncbi:MAG TPA: type VI secretion system membrane subunit TssM [Sandaracinaceae bacterium LLY-WYZ-13_1]|nr:type VI secretion system membrane subunit TssM [Sandaracinaceae bacterium LLY-WYZ-13_1]